MLTATPALTTFLNTNTQGISIPVVTITLHDGTVLRWARWKTDVTFGGVTWGAHGQGGRPLISTYRWRTVMGLDEIGTLEMRFDCGDGAAVLNGVPLTRAVADGALNDAKVLLERLYLATPEGAVVGKLFRFQGWIVGTPPSDSHGVSISAENVVARLRSTRLPKTLLSASCGNALFDGACGVSRVAWQADTTAAAGCTRTSLVLNGTWAADHWALGEVRVGTGSAAQYRGVRSSSGTGVVLTNPLPAAPAAGTLVQLTAGCDHTVGTRGCARFNNLARFRGAPHLPKENG